MALPTRNTQLNEIADIDTFYNGGKGSGNFGHSGRPGEVGGSAPSGSGMSGKGDSKADIEKEIAETEDELFAVQDELQDEYQWGGNAGTAVLAHLESREEELQQKLGELVDKQKKQQKDSEVSKAKAEREEHIKQIDKILGSEKITEGKTKAEDDKNYKKLEKDAREIKRILAKEKSRENFGQDEIRKLKDKYSDYMSGNWSTIERFKRIVDDLEDWADNYQNY